MEPLNANPLPKMRPRLRQAKKNGQFCKPNLLVLPSKLDTLDHLLRVNITFLIKKDDIFEMFNTTFSASTVLILVIRFVISNYVVTGKPFSLADFQHFISFL